MMLEVLLLLGSLQLLSVAEASTYPVGKPHCNATCGNITFPFPFGIGPGCFLGDWYEIVCEANNTVPRLKKLGLQVLNISLKQGSSGEDAAIIVSYPMAYSDMSCTHNQSRRSVPLNGSPYILSSSLNIFVAVGCNNMAVMECEGEPLFLGCKTHCTGANTSRYSACNGFDCCRATIPSGLQGFNINFPMEDNTGSSAADHDCRFAFLIYRDLFHPSLTDLYALREEDYVPMVLQWGIQSASIPRSLGIEVDLGSRSRSVPSQCQTVSYKFSDTTPFITCFCNDGYDGNPYLHDGCKGTINVFFLF